MVREGSGGNELWQRLVCLWGRWKRGDCCDCCEDGTRRRMRKALG